MKIAFVLLLLFMSCSVCNGNTLLETKGKRLLKHMMSDATQLSYDVTKHQSGHLKRKQYDLSVTRTLTQSLFLEASLDVTLHNSDLGVYQVRADQGAVRLFHCYKMTDNFDLGAGFIYSGDTRIRSSDQQLNIPSSQTWALTSRFTGWYDDHKVEFQISSRRWDSSKNSIAWFETGRTEQQLELSYVGHF